MDIQYTQKNMFYDEFENITSSHERKGITKEASDDKHKAAYVIKKLSHVLAFLGLSNVTKKTQLQTQCLLINNLEDFKGVFSFDEIKKAYYEECQKARINHRLLFNQTTKEKDFIKLLKTKTRLKIETAVLFADSSLDLYLHALAIAIEIDGNFHNKEAKIIRDHYKIEICSLLGIKLMSIKNEDINSPNVRSFIEQVNSLPVLNSIKRREVYLSLMVFTLLVTRPKFIESYFGINLNQLDILTILGIEKMLVKKSVTENQLKTVKRVLIRY